ncbi:hypothetical protein CYMTET_12469, partial [Cymbomonas tetramitiformis]
LSAAKRTRDEAISLCAGYEEYLSAREKENMDLTWRELDHAIEMQAEEEQKKNDPEHKPSKKMCPSFEALARLWAPSSLPWSDADMLRASADWALPSMATASNGKSQSPIKHADHLAAKGI